MSNACVRRGEAKSASMSEGDKIKRTFCKICISRVSRKNNSGQRDPLGRLVKGFKAHETKTSSFWGHQMKQLVDKMTPPLAIFLDSTQQPCGNTMQGAALMLEWWYKVLVRRWNTWAWYEGEPRTVRAETVWIHTELIRRSRENKFPGPLKQVN